MMKRRWISILSIALILILALTVTACEQIVTDLIAGGGNEASEIDAGDTLVWDDGTDYLYILAVMANWIGPGDEIWEETDWRIVDAHAHVALEPNDIPQTKKDNPIPGKFDLQYEDGEWELDEDDMVVMGGWEIPLTQAMIDADPLYIALHLEIVDDQGTEDIEDDIYESVWADGTDFEGKNWATYFEYVIGTNPEPEI